jgi:hypothetical protein
MKISPIIRYVLLGAAAGLVCLTVADGFHAAGQAGIREALSAYIIIAQLSASDAGGRGLNR